MKMQVNQRSDFSERIPSSPRGQQDPLRVTKHCVDRLLERYGNMPAVFQGGGLSLDPVDGDYDVGINREHCVAFLRALFYNGRLFAVGKGGRYRVFIGGRRFIIIRDIYRDGGFVTIFPEDPEPSHSRRR